MVKLTMIARVTDGLPLAEGLDDGRDVPDADYYKQQVKSLFKNLSRGQNEPSRMSIETGPYIFQLCQCHMGLEYGWKVMVSVISNHPLDTDCPNVKAIDCFCLVDFTSAKSEAGSVTFNLYTQETALCCLIPTGDYLEFHKHSEIPYGAFLLQHMFKASLYLWTVLTLTLVSSYIIEGRVCYLTMCDRAYPKKLSFQYLEDLKKEFERVYGDQIETAGRPYAFIKFDTFILKTKKLYQDTRTQRNISKLNDELYEVHQIMTRNVQEVLGVGEKLDQVSEMSSRLTSESRIYADKAKDLNRQALIRKWAPVAIVLGVVFLLFWVKNKLW
ncbi:25.3 kDa vesicle transport protein-like [Dorcoceras hygrometricum]|uniref:25.3 kDa vesicle transport protein-like n=1 Tax=Dorcoceras hygrometricum TaxID=472368 RepID=A0A2Z7BI53_9LAMI|nr:25.3 kDa vesicle transport protein-like [Dorcoceras hygrometricum]